MLENSTFDDTIEYSPIKSIVLTSFIAVVSFAALAGNSLVVLTFFKDVRLRTSTNSFIINMAVSDILSSSTNWPLAAMEGLLSSSNPMGASTFVCKLGMYCRVFSQAISVQSLVFIAGDRFNAIVRPFKAIHVGTKHRTAVMMFTWISSLSLCSPYVVSSKIVIHGRYTFCRFEEPIEKRLVYIGFLALILYCTPLVLISVLYVQIMKTLRRVIPEVGEQNRLRRMHQYRMTMRIFVWIVSAFFICWTALAVYVIFKAATPKHFTEDRCNTYLVLLFYGLPVLNAAINPLIIFLSSTRFSKALRQTVCCYICQTFHLSTGKRRISPTQAIREIRHG